MRFSLVWCEARKPTLKIHNNAITEQSRTERH
jgi:hypothetical protein